MILSFDTDVAKEVGADAATIFYHITYWVMKNEANNKHFYDGKYWTYNSVAAFDKLFPHLKTKQIRNALDKLEAQGYIVTGNYNKLAYDRTKWYSLGCKGFNYFNPTNETICPNGQIHLPKRANPLAEKGEPIPDNYPDNYSDKDMSGTPDLVARVISYLNRKAGVAYKPNTQATIRLIHAREKEGFKAEDFKAVIDNMCREWKNDPKMKKYLRPATLFAASKFEGYLNMGRKVVTSPSDGLSQEERKKRKEQELAEMTERLKAEKEKEELAKQEQERKRQEYLNSPEYKRMKAKGEAFMKKLIGGE